jgi:hypothetical protein
MEERVRVEQIIGDAAWVGSAYCALRAVDRQDGIVPLAQNSASIVEFLQGAGDIGGETLFRWAAAKNLHPFSAGDFQKVRPEIRLWWECFAVIAKALLPILDPPQKEVRASLPLGHERRRPDDNAYETYGAPGRRTYENLAPGQPTSSAQLTIGQTQNPPPPVPDNPTPHVALTVTQEDLARMTRGKGAAQTFSPLAALEHAARQRAIASGAASEEEIARRAQAYAMAGDAHGILDAAPPPAPEEDYVFDEMSVTRPDGAGGIASGAVMVGRLKDVDGE